MQWTCWSFLFQLEMVFLPAINGWVQLRLSAASEPDRLALPLPFQSSWQCHSLDTQNQNRNNFGHPSLKSSSGWPLNSIKAIGMKIQALDFGFCPLPPPTLGLISPGTNLVAFPIRWAAPPNPHCSAVNTLWMERGAAVCTRIKMWSTAYVMKMGNVRKNYGSCSHSRGGEPA